MSGPGPDDRARSVAELLKEGEENAAQAEAGPWAKVAQVPVSYLTERPPPERWLLKDLGQSLSDEDGCLRMGKAGILAAPGGTGKSWALVALALAVATGREWLSAGGAEPVRGFPVATPGRVALLMGEEDAHEVQRRLFWTARLMGLSREDQDKAAGNLYVGALTGESLALLDEDGEPSELASMLYKHLRKLPHSGGLTDWSAILIDPLSRFGNLQAETDNAHATRVSQVLEALTKLPGNPAVLIAHHERKGGGVGVDAVRGAKGLTDGPRWIARLIGLDEPNQVRSQQHVQRWRTPTGHRAARIRIPKSNYTGPLAAPIMVLDGEFKGAVRLATADETAAWKAANSDTPTDTPARVRRPRRKPPV